MELKKITSFSRLTFELNNLGRFTENAPCCAASYAGKEILDFLYDELVDMGNHNQYSSSGKLMEVVVQPTKVMVRSFHKSGTTHIKSFECDDRLHVEMLSLVASIPSIYHSIRVVPEFNFVPQSERTVSYFLEYNTPR